MIKRIIKDKFFIKDILFNSFSFAIYVISQQIILMPIMGKLLPEKTFASFIIFISIFSIISNTLGSEIGIVRQIKNDKDANQYNLIMRWLLIFVFLISITCILFLQFSLLETIMFSFVIVLANIRLYICSCFRINKNFKNVMIQNVLYLIGLLIGLFLFTKIKYLWIPSMFAETFSLFFSLRKADFSFVAKKEKIEKKILLSFKDLSIIEFLINMMTYFDKILIYPILGTNAVNTYYATTTMSKIVSLISNPLHSVLLSWIKGDKESKVNSLKLIFKYCLPLVIIISIITIPLTYYAVLLLYKSYLEASISIIIPISIGTGFSFVSSIIKAFVLKYINSKKILKTYIKYLASFVVFSLILSHFYGLFGFALANMISRIVLFMLFINVLMSIKKEENTNER